MTRAAVVDTNVGVVANGDQPQASFECVADCVRRLTSVTEGRVQLVVDDSFEIVAEYQKHLSRSGEPGVGDVFMKWVHDHQYTIGRCIRVCISEHPERGYHEFPDDMALSGFDPSDRKFAAAAVVSPTPAPVWNAVDSDWWDFERALRRNGIEVEHVCESKVAEWQGTRARP